MRSLVFPVLMATATSVQAETPRVAVDIAPLHGLVSQVMEGVGTPDLVIPQGASPHGYSMRPSQAAALEVSDLVIWVGEGLTPWLAEPIEVLAGDAVHLELLEVEGIHLIEYLRIEYDVLRSPTFEAAKSRAQD